MAQEKIERKPLLCWQQRNFYACLLWPLSLIFGCVVKLRRWWLTGVKTPWRAPVPVVIIGNIIVGGAGKTPSLLAVLSYLQQQGYCPGIISRGYGRQNENCCLEVHTHTPARLAGDEALLLKCKTRVPVFVAARRPQAVQALLKAYPEVNVILSDDGLQHYALGRDVEVIVFDERGVGNGWLLPAGPLREPCQRARVPQCLILYNAKQPSLDLPGFLARRQLAGWLPLAQWLQGAGLNIGWRSFSELVDIQPPLRMAAVAGIGQPQRFFDMLGENGLVLERSLALADHVQGDGLMAVLQTLPYDVIFLTEKDAAKCLQDMPEALLHKVKVIGLDYQLEKAFFDKLDTMIAGCCFDAVQR